VKEKKGLVRLQQALRELLILLVSCQQYFADFLDRFSLPDLAELGGLF
jgi:hypothetical protein